MLINIVNRSKYFRDMKYGNKFILIPIYLFYYEGSRSIIAYLKSKGFDARSVYFGEVLADEEPPSEDLYKILFDKLCELKPDVVGLSFFCTQRNVARKVAEFCKSKLNILVVAGGVQATISPEDILEFADVVIMGDGEKPLEVLLEKYNGDKDILKDVPGSVYFDKNKNISYGPLSVYLDLNTLPFPDMDEDAYFISKNSIRIGPELNYIHVFCSRGCPFKCTYCINSCLNELSNKPRIRHKSPEYILEELERKKLFFKDATRVTFEDEMFLAKKVLVEKLLNEYPKRIGLPFGCQFHPNTIDEEMMDLLVNAGMLNGRCGIEAMSEKTRQKIFGRSTRDKDIIKVARLFNKYPNVRLVFDLVVNNPLESEDDIQKGFDFMLTIPGKYELFVHILMHLPKTRLTTRLLQEGLISECHVEGYNENTMQWALNILDPNLKVDYPYGLDRFWLYMCSMLSKKFIPRRILKILSRSRFLKKHPRPLFFLAYISNMINIFFIFIKILINGEFKILHLLKTFSDSKFDLFKWSR